MKNKKINPWIFWIPRVLAIMYIAFISMFAFDVFDTGLGFRGILLALFMHLIPSFILIIILIISRKRELVGAIFFFLCGLAYIFVDIYSSLSGTRDAIYPGPHFSWRIMIAGPAILTGFLFLKNWKIKKKME